MRAEAGRGRISRPTRPAAAHDAQRCDRAHLEKTAARTRSSKCRTSPIRRSISSICAVAARETVDRRNSGGQRQCSSAASYAGALACLRSLARNLQIELLRDDVPNGRTVRLLRFRARRTLSLGRRSSSIIVANYSSDNSSGGSSIKIVRIEHAASTASAAAVDSTRRSGRNARAPAASVGVSTDSSGADRPCCEGRLLRSNYHAGVATVATTMIAPLVRDRLGQVHGRASRLVRPSSGAVANGAAAVRAGRGSWEGAAGVAEAAAVALRSDDRCPCRRRCRRRRRRRCRVCKQLARCGPAHPLHLPLLPGLQGAARQAPIRPVPLPPAPMDAARRAQHGDAPLAPSCAVGRRLILAPRARAWPDMATNAAETDAADAGKTAGRPDVASGLAGGVGPLELMRLCGVLKVRPCCRRARAAAAVAAAVLVAVCRHRRPLPRRPPSPATLVGHCGRLPLSVAALCGRPPGRSLPRPMRDPLLLPGGRFSGRRRERILVRVARLAPGI